MKEKDLPPELLNAFDLARRAPSAANSQFWRFRVSPDYKTVSIAKPVDYKHFKWEHPDVDIGICACHFWLGLMTQDIDCRVSLDEERGRALWHFLPAARLMQRVDIGGCAVFVHAFNINPGSIVGYIGHYR
jgi:hypothetical protein